MIAGQANSIRILVVGLLCLASGIGIYFAFGRSDSLPPSLSIDSTEQDLPESILVPGGLYVIGNDTGPRDSRPSRQIKLSPFAIDRTEVTNAMFAAFVEATGYRTDAERRGESLCFDNKSLSFVTQKDAHWRQPGGPGSSILGKEDYPVVHVSWYDANAYASWAGKSLPTEFQWEAAARGKSLGNSYPWNSEANVEPHERANLWQGEFPIHDQAKDGYHGLAAVGSFPTSTHGIYDLAGNVAEWTSSHYAADSYDGIAKENPTGPSRGEMRVVRGGSWLSSDQTGTSEAHVWYRGKLTPETSNNFTGFRCVSPP